MVGLVQVVVVPRGDRAPRLVSFPVRSVWTRLRGATGKVGSTSEILDNGDVVFISVVAVDADHKGVGEEDSILKSSVVLSAPVTGEVFRSCEVYQK